MKNILGSLIADRYTIESVLGSGGMSTVYKGYDQLLHRHVAIKMIHPHLFEKSDVSERFEREAKIIAGIKHQNIVQVYDLIRNDTCFIVLELVDGTPLDNMIQLLNKKNKQMPLSIAIRIFFSVCQAVQYLHAKDIVHRDLKPSNIIVQPDYQPILLDFGVIKIQDSDLTTTGIVLGSVPYMAPEQIKGDPVDKRCDIYSLGIIFCEMLTGRKPYSGKPVENVIMQHLTAPLPSLEQLSSKWAGDLEGIIHRAMAKQPAERFQTMKELLDALRVVVDKAKQQTRRSFSRVSGRGRFSGMGPTSSEEKFLSSAFFSRAERILADKVGVLAQLIIGDVLGEVKSEDLTATKADLQGYIKEIVDRLPQDVDRNSVSASLKKIVPENI